MLLAVAEGQSREGREIDAVRSEVQCLHAGNREPEPRIDAAGIYPWRDGSDSGGSAVDGDFGFAEAGVAAALKVRWKRRWERRCTRIRRRYWLCE